MKLLFRYEGDEGKQASVLRSAIIGFGQRPAEEPHFPQVGSITVSADNGAVIIVGSVETNQTLMDRYEADEAEMEANP